MDVVALAHGEPCFDFGVFVSGVVVGDDVDVEGLGDVGVDVSEEGEELLVSVTGFALGEELAGGDVEGGKQGGGSVADVIVGATFEVSQAHGEHGLGAVEGLDLGFFVHAQYHRMVGGIEIEAYDVTDLFDEGNL